MKPMMLSTAGQARACDAEADSRGGGKDIHGGRGAGCCGQGGVYDQGCGVGIEGACRFAAGPADSENSTRFDPRDPVKNR